MYKIANDKSFVRLNGRIWTSTLFGGIANDIFHGLVHIHNYLFEMNIVLKNAHIIVMWSHVTHSFQSIFNY
jgi:hypothetical protein